MNKCLCVDIQVKMMYIFYNKRVGNYSETKIPENGYTHTILRTND